MNAYEFFSDKELTCQCGCDQMLMDPKFMAHIVEGRRALDFAFVVSSGYRCPEHNNKISSTGYNGPHTTGRAIDIRAGSRQKALIIDYFRDVGFSRFGVARSFIHLDDLTRPDGFAENVVWTY
jgi:zinc D-Ala-D-Ala carboxypeptidase